MNNAEFIHADEKITTYYHYTLKSTNPIDDAILKSLKDKRIECYMTVHIQCPFCEETVEAGDATAQGEHMRTKHREIVIQRFRNANMHQEADQLEKEGTDHEGAKT